ncbi:MAG: septum formation initiator family protein [Bacteroidales bacterium]|nr:septum formation initiator family protein [Bacteroidales bacterium]MCF8390324.1 septum formation initiator family protein [Bacteroidales bacterium]
MMRLINKYLPVLTAYFKNKYLVTIVLFFIWVLIFDQNNLFERVKLMRQVNQLEDDRDYYSDRILIDSARLIELKTSAENLEKFAREQYLMKKKNEEIFVIVEK